MRALREATAKTPVPSVTGIAESTRNAFQVLISTMISLRTKDDVTMEASRRLLSVAATPGQIAELRASEIADLIYPAGFYRTKAKSIQRTAQIILERHKGRVPNSLEALLELPGVGRKTANLVLGRGFGIPAICVDTHVHRISNRLGWIATDTPEHTELALQEVLPREYWIEINDLLVRFGQSTCSPLSPHCSTCTISPQCPRIGVTRSR